VNDVNFISPLLKWVVYPSLARTRCLRWLAQSGLAVVTYHGVIPEGYLPVDAAFDGNLVTAAALRRQLRLLKAHYNLISPEEFLAWR